MSCISVTLCSRLNSTCIFNFYRLIFYSSMHSEPLFIRGSEYMNGKIIASVGVVLRVPQGSVLGPLFN